MTHHSTYPVACCLLEFGAATNSIVSVGPLIVVATATRSRRPGGSSTQFANSGHWRVTWRREGRRSFAASGVDPGRRNAPAEVKGAVKSFPRSQGGYISSHSPQHEEQARQLVLRSPHTVESGACRSSACRWYSTAAGWWSAEIGLQQPFCSTPTVL
jgi:hypothetical protein